MVRVPPVSTKHPQSRRGRLDSMRHQVATATSGRCPHSVTFLFFTPSSLKSRTPSFSAGLGLSVSRPGLAVIGKAHPLLRKSLRTAVRPAYWWWWDGGAGSTAACRARLLCKALAGTGGQRPVNSMLQHDGMHAGQVSARPGRGLLPWTLPACACECNSTCNESRAWGARWLRAQTMDACSLDTAVHRLARLVAASSGGGLASHHRSDLISQGLGTIGLLVQ